MRIGKLRLMLALVALCTLAALPTHVSGAAGRIPSFNAQALVGLTPVGPVVTELALATMQAPAPPAAPAAPAPASEIPQDSLGDPKKPQAEVESIPPATAAAGSCAPACQPKCCTKTRKPLLARLGRCCRAPKCGSRGLLRCR